MISRGAVEFQSTLPRRERRYTIYLYQISTLYFNPRSREGSDRPILYRRFKLLQISIHAPAKGATAPPLIRRIHCCYFNPRSREGSDAFFTNFACSAIRFQSTLPRRERPGLGRRRLWLGNFNPRSREGSDILADALGILTVTISIHAPAKGATSIQSCRYDNRTDFNPRSREGSDAGSHLPSRSLIDFNPRSREGSDRCNREIDRFKKNFNPRSREGSDLSFKNFLNSAIYFNPRSREGSD